MTFRMLQKRIHKYTRSRDYWLYSLQSLRQKRVKIILQNINFQKTVKLTTKCVFSANSRLIKQIDGCPMKGPISTVLSDIYICKMEEDIVTPSKPLFYKCYVDDTYVRRKTKKTDELDNVLNWYHQNIKLIKRFFEVTAKLQLKCTIKWRNSL